MADFCQFRPSDLATSSGPFSHTHWISLLYRRVQKIEQIEPDHCDISQNNGTKNCNWMALVSYIRNCGNISQMSRTTKSVEIQDPKFLFCLTHCGWGCQLVMPPLQGWGLTFWCRFYNFWYAISRSLETQVFDMKTSALGSYLCNLNSEWLQFFRKLCSLTNSKMAENRCLAKTNAFKVKKNFEGCLKYLSPPQN